MDPPNVCRDRASALSATGATLDAFARGHQDGHAMTHPALCTGAFALNVCPGGGGAASNGNVVREYTVYDGPIHSEDDGTFVAGAKPQRFQIVESRPLTVG